MGVVGVSSLAFEGAREAALLVGSQEASLHLLNMAPEGRVQLVSSWFFRCCLQGRLAVHRACQVPRCTCFIWLLKSKVYALVVRGKRSSDWEPDGGHMRVMLVTEHSATPWAMIMADATPELQTHTL